MSQQPDLELLPREDRVILAIQAIKSDASLSQQRAAAIYNVSRSTLGQSWQQTNQIKSSPANGPTVGMLQMHEEEAIIQYIRKLDAQGFAPTLSYVREMANQLLAKRSGS
ncbi:hypothetical protein EJ07DRAFT_133183 [Lizonia empirigonia]|nr:hypothetical protein EJ07DRAFT_133183 [Lizonia empirigonia]